MAGASLPARSAGRLHDRSLAVRPTQVTRWVEEGVFDAIERKFLRSVVFAIYDSENCDTVSERADRR